MNFSHSYLYFPSHFVGVDYAESMKMMTDDRWLFTA